MTKKRSKATEKMKQISESEHNEMNLRNGVYSMLDQQFFGERREHENKRFTLKPWSDAALLCAGIQ